MGPLAGRRVVITRRAGQVSPLARLLEERGATTVEVPAIEIVPPRDTGPLDRSLRGLQRFQWLVFTSANTVEAVRQRLQALALPLRLTAGGPQLASIGSATSAALRSSFPDDALALEPPSGASAEALVRAFAGRSVAGARVLAPGSSRARDELARGLRALGAEVEVVVAYETVEPPDLRQKLDSCLAEGFDLVVFASPSAVEAFASAGGSRARGRAAVVIGRTTERAAAAAGFDVRAVAETPTAEGLARAAETVLTASY